MPYATCISFFIHDLRKLLDDIRYDIFYIIHDTLDILHLVSTLYGHVSKSNLGMRILMYDMVFSATRLTTLNMYFYDVQFCMCLYNLRSVKFHNRMAVLLVVLLVGFVVL